jgi:hypothetical protein
MSAHYRFGTDCWPALASIAFGGTGKSFLDGNSSQLFKVRPSYILIDVVHFKGFGTNMLTISDNSTAPITDVDQTQAFDGLNDAFLNLWDIDWTMVVPATILNDCCPDTNFS